MQKALAGGFGSCGMKEEIPLDLIHAYRFFVHVEIIAEEGKKWLLTAMYAIPNASIRKHLWESLDEM